MKRWKSIGILGGTFNPIHLGHLLTAQDALEQLELERVVFIPSAMPPHKSVNKLASARDRLHMIKLTIRGNDRFEVDDIEIKRGGKSYSVDTLTELHRRNPRADFFFIIGADSLRELHLWREVERLVTLCTFVTVPRPGLNPNRLSIPDWVRRRGGGCGSTSCAVTRATSLPGTFARVLPAGGLYAILSQMPCINTFGGDDSIVEG